MGATTKAIWVPKECKLRETTITKAATQKEFPRHTREEESSQVYFIRKPTYTLRTKVEFNGNIIDTTVTREGKVVTDWSDEIPNALKDFLMDSRNTFVGVDVENDAKLLQNDYGLELANLADLRYLAVDKFNSDIYKTYGLKSLTKDVLDVDLEKGRAAQGVCLLLPLL
ncbi:hypothetical protein IFM89_029368 [Coptis chinensis]|uniref:3'-5' exonuclease domain-containing protein n=1 Tax=Coptis chinensis TaxID=261450 RepID=A0A835IR75_9MAGN|nr:hypothetical protein IFM89_029368 [Coptis chinensis]